MPPSASLLALARRVERLLLPAECLLCREAVPASDGDALICAICRSRWARVPPPLCPRCGATAERDEPCTTCAGWLPGLRAVRSAVWLDESARRAVHALKYDGWWRASEAMAAVMTTLDPLTGPLLLVPIPLGARRRRQRGYNQSECLAGALAALGAPGRGWAVRADVLARRRETPTQTALTPEERAANVAGAFTASTAAAGCRCVLVDDVFTTGATLLEAAAALHLVGAASVDAVTFARARRAVG
jgi:ComF family protein